MMKKYNLYKQKYSYDCGIACIAMILKYYNISFDYGKLMTIEEIDPQKGCSLLQMSRILKKFNIDASGYHFENEEYESLIQTAPFIANIKVGSNIFHYIDVFECDKRNLIIGDPSSTHLIILSCEMFCRLSTGALLIINKKS